MPEPDPFEVDRWCVTPFLEQRRALADALTEGLHATEGVREVRVESGPSGREYDLTAAVETDVGVLRTPLWSHGRAMIFCDPSVHPANREQLSPRHALRQALEQLRSRLAVPYALESRGLTFTVEPEPGVQRSWTAEHSLFRKRTSVTREDRVLSAGELDVRDLLAHFYTGPSVRLVAASGEAFLLPGAPEAEGPLVSLCQAERHWSAGDHPKCPECGGPVDVIIAARPPRR